MSSFTAAGEPTRRGLYAHGVAVFLCAIAVGCAGTPERAGAHAARATGGIDASLQIDDGPTLEALSYTITGPASFEKSGSIDVQRSSTVSAVIGPLPAGSGFSIELDGTATDGTTTCRGSANFDVAAGATTPVTVHLVCHEAPRAGSVLLSGSLNVCPSIDGLGASPSGAVVGTVFQLTGAAHDLDDGPSPIAYAWSTDLGTLDDRTARNPTLTCDRPGTAHVMLSVSDGDPLCVESRSIGIDCAPPMSGDAGD